MFTVQWFSVTEKKKKRKINPVLQKLECFLLTILFLQVLFKEIESKFHIYLYNKLDTGIFGLVNIIAWNHENAITNSVS